MSQHAAEAEGSTCYFGYGSIQITGFGPDGNSRSFAAWTIRKPRALALISHR